MTNAPVPARRSPRVVVQESIPPILIQGRAGYRLREMWHYCGWFIS